jgi:hypothetical protein
MATGRGGVLETHDHALAFFLARGLCAERRVWVLGDTVGVFAGPSAPDSHGIVIYADVTWLVPGHDAAWDLVQSVRQHERRRSFPSLHAACCAAVRWTELFDLRESCPACGGGRRYSFGESRRFERPYAWWRSDACSVCGVTETDGEGPMPQELRRLELERTGAWCVQLVREQTLSGWSTVREALGLSPAVLGELKRRLPCVIFRGTQGEALWFSRRFGQIVAWKLLCADDSDLGQL